MQFLKTFSRIVIRLLLATGGGISAWHMISAMEKNAIHDIAISFSTTAGTLLGFTITALSILVAVSDRRLVSNLIATGHYNRLWRELYFTSIGYLIALCLSIVCLFLRAENLDIGVSFAAAAMTFSTILLISAGHKFYLVMTNIK